MLKKIVFSIIILIGTYLFFNFAINNDKFSNLKSLLNNDQKDFLKRYLFPHKVIEEKERFIEEKANIIRTMTLMLADLELKTKKIGGDIITSKTRVKLSNNKIMQKYRLEEGFYAGISLGVPGSGYIDFHKDNLFIISSKGVLAFTKSFSDKIVFKQIRHNTDDFLGLKQITKDNWFSLKDILIHEDKIFLSYTEEIKDDCWNTSIIYGDISYENIIFKKLFSPEECVHSKNNIDNEYNGGQSGGRMVVFDDNHILFTIGDYRSRHLAQNKESVNGKIFKINLTDGNYELISIGHRNPQGLFFDRESNLIIETEHGPQGGDEINLIEVEKIKSNIIANYGWPIASAGEHYGGRIKSNLKKYEKYPLYKSHKEHGFIEPIKSFVPSIGISEITKIQKNKYVLSSLADKSIYFFDLNENKKIINFERVEVFERVRDIRFYKNKLYLFLENTASLGIINLN